MDVTKDLLLQLALIAALIFAFQIFYADRDERSNRTKMILSLLFGLAILLCMSFPAHLSPNIRLDIRIVPLLLGTLYGGWRTGLFLSALIILYRLYLGADLGVYTTILTLFISMPVIVFLQKSFAEARKIKRILIALQLAMYYGLTGIILGALIRGFSSEVLKLQLIYMGITVLVVAFFTSLNETINEMNEKNKQLQTDANYAEIAFLRSQIKPHFLYNALNSIAALCIDEPRKAEALTLDLSQYLRTSFDFKSLDSVTTIERELELVQAYINIEKARFGARLNVEYDVDPDLDIGIPPLILQPLVENAIRHGLMSNLKGGTVRITVKKQADALVRFAVEDNGCGMSERELEEILNLDVKKKGVGLWNISQRIKLIYGEGLRMESTVGIGTKISFDIPASRVKQIGG